MQDKHFVIVHYKEDRDIFINKIKYPKTVYHVGDNPQPGDIQIDPKHGSQALLAKYILDNYDNLPEFVILSQADPTDHVHEPLLAFESTLTGKWGSFCYARSMYNQYSTSWVRLNPIRNVARELGIKFHNDNNVSKSLYYFFPGEIFYVSKEKILERPKSFYQKIIDIDNNNPYKELLKQESIPTHVYKDLVKFHPELKGMTNEEKIETLSPIIPGKKTSMMGWCFEALWMLIWSDDETLKMLDQSQMCIGNQLYFNTNAEKYDPNFKFEKFPYSENVYESNKNFRLFENDWFDWNCPNYLKWREKLVEKTIWEGEQRNFDANSLLNYYLKIGYKHISF